MNFPDNLKYTNDHEWIKIDGDHAYVGITDFAQNELGDIVYVEIETEGDTMNSGDVFGTIEAVKTVSDLFMPVSGEITEVNNLIADQPELINESPYEKGWLIKIKLSNPEEINDLLTTDAYKEIVE